jgi:hypothetical protein
MAPPLGAEDEDEEAPAPPDDDDVYLIKLQREVLQNLISTRRMQISQICGISKENTHGNIKSSPTALGAKVGVRVGNAGAVVGLAWPLMVGE